MSVLATDVQLLDSALQHYFEPHVGSGGNECAALAVRAPEILPDGIKPWRQTFDLDGVEANTECYTMTTPGYTMRLWPRCQDYRLMPLSESALLASTLTWLLKRGAHIWHCGDHMHIRLAGAHECTDDLHWLAVRAAHAFLDRMEERSATDG